MRRSDSRKLLFNLGLKCFHHLNRTFSRKKWKGCTFAPPMFTLLYGCIQKKWYPQIIHFNRGFHYKPSILGVTLFLETSIYLVLFFSPIGLEARHRGIPSHRGKVYHHRGGCFPRGYGYNYDTYSISVKAGNS